MIGAQAIFDFFPANGSRRSIALNVLILILLLIFAAQYVYITWTSLGSGDMWFNDFFGIWSFSKFAATHEVLEIYHNSVLHDFQMDLGGAPQQHLPFAYPPSFLLLTFWLGYLPFYAAYLLWVGGTASLYFMASFGRGDRPAGILMVLLAPATILTAVFGQTGFLSSALLIGGFRLAPRWPLVGGILLGLLSFKPQLGLLVPVALIAARHWRALAAASVTCIALFLASSIAYGWSSWAIWLAKLPTHANWAIEVKTYMQPTILANLVLLRTDLVSARIAQLCFALAVAVVIWICFRGGITALTTAALAVGAILATPYAFPYDTPMLTNAVLAVIDGKTRTGRRLTMGPTGILLLSIFMPMIITDTSRFFLAGSISLILMLALIVWYIFSEDQPKPAPALEVVVLP